MDRLSRIAKACMEIDRCREDLASGPPRNPLGGAFLGYLDWVTELHRLIHDWKEAKNDVTH
jgi:hypothetical protein